MKFKPTKIVTLLLLTAFLTTCLGSMLGCISCDSGCLSDIHIGNHTDNHIVAHIDNYTEPLDQHISDRDDSCIDSPIQLSKGIFKEIKSIEWHSNLATISTNERLTTLKNIRFVASNLPQKFPPTISQTILTHRTIVILT